MKTHPLNSSNTDEPEGYSEAALYESTRDDEEEVDETEVSSSKPFLAVAVVIKHCTEVKVQIDLLHKAGLGPEPVMNEMLGHDLFKFKVNKLFSDIAKFKKTYYKSLKRSI